MTFCRSQRVTWSQYSYTVRKNASSHPSTEKYSSAKRKRKRSKGLEWSIFYRGCDVSRVSQVHPHRGKARTKKTLGEVRSLIQQYSSGRCFAPCQELTSSTPVVMAAVTSVPLMASLPQSWWSKRPQRSRSVRPQ